MCAGGRADCVGRSSSWLEITTLQPMVKHHTALRNLAYFDSTRERNGMREEESETCVWVILSRTYPVQNLQLMVKNHTTRWNPACCNLQYNWERNGRREEESKTCFFWVISSRTCVHIASECNWRSTGRCVRRRCAWRS